MSLKKPRFAGSWYPGTGKECERTMRQFEDDLGPISLPDERSSVGAYGGIVPHAGWVFSGKTAYAVYSRIRTLGANSHAPPDLIFVFGMHLGPGGSNYLFVDDGFETPLGSLLVDTDVVSRLSSQFNFVEETAVDSVSDNTIELQLPFVKHVFPEAKVVTLGVSPDERAVAIGETAFNIARELDRTPCFIGSTDLTHYGPNYGFTPQGLGKKSVQWVKDQNDAAIIDCFRRADPGDVIRTGLSLHNACCPGSAAAAIAAVCRGGVDRGFLVDYSTSYDRHPDSSFVGYAGVLY
jgi:AmmeMemoRadiSam system protein B